MTAWLSRGWKIKDGIVVGTQLSAGAEWQLYSTCNQGFAVAVSQSLFERWRKLIALPADLFEKQSISQRDLYIAYDKHDSIIASVKHGPYPDDYGDALAFAAALNQSRQSIPNESFGDALYFERYSLVLPTFDGEGRDDQTVLCSWLASGVELSLDKFDRLCEIVSWMPPTALISVIQKAGFAVSQDAAITVGKSMTAKKGSTGRDSRALPEIGERFTLPGRPAIEAFFNEQVVDIIRDHEKYQRMGISFPSAIILHGPPGSGKTFAVDCLIDFLHWPSFRIDSGSIGSPFIHDTSKRISEVFDQAADSAPSIVVIDEMDAFLSARNQSQGFGQHHAEEVAEFLRRIPEARGKKVLVIAMTNLIEAIDPAFLRRGRFDHIIEVQMPSKKEVESLLRHLLESLPIEEDIDYDGLAAHLQGHAMSDASFVVREAGRLAVKENKDVLCNDLLNRAIKALPKENGNIRKIGF